MQCEAHQIARVCQSEGNLDPKAVRELASACNIAYRGPIPLPLLKQIGQDTFTCTQLIASKTNTQPYVSVDAQINKFFKLLHNRGSTVDVPPVRSTKYRGFPESAIYGLMYLLRRNENECVIVSNISRIIERIKSDPLLRIDDLTELDWASLGIVWHWKDCASRFDVTFPHGEDAYIEATKACSRNPQTRFVITVITLVSKTGTHHANILLYDNLNHVLERFEPYQASNANQQTDVLDERLCLLYKQIDPTIQRFIRPPNFHFFMQPGLQLRQERENRMTHQDPVGFCQPWTFLYADTRLAFPDQIPEKIPELLQQWADQQHITLTEFIRNFSEHLYTTSRTVFGHYLHSDYQVYVDPEVQLLRVALEQLSICMTVMT